MERLIYFSCVLNLNFSFLLFLIVSGYEPVILFNGLGSLVTCTSSWFILQL